MVRRFTQPLMPMTKSEWEAVISFCQQTSEVKHWFAVALWAALPRAALRVVVDQHQLHDGKHAYMYLCLFSCMHPVYMQPKPTSTESEALLYVCLCLLFPCMQQSMPCSMEGLWSEYSHVHVYTCRLPCMYPSSISLVKWVSTAAYIYVCLFPDAGVPACTAWKAPKRHSGKSKEKAWLQTACMWKTS